MGLLGFDDGCFYLPSRRLQDGGGGGGSRVADPYPNPDPDPHVFGPPGSGYISQRHESRSGSFYHHAKIVRKTLIPTIL